MQISLSNSEERFLGLLAKKHPDQKAEVSEVILGTALALQRAMTLADIQALLIDVSEKVELIFPVKEHNLEDGDLSVYLKRYQPIIKIREALHSLIINMCIKTAEDKGFGVPISEATGIFVHNSLDAALAHISDAST